MGDFDTFMYQANEQLFGAAWCGPEAFEHGKSTLVATYKAEGDGQGVHVYCTAMPAKFYKLVVFPGSNSAGEMKPGYSVGTGSGMARWAAETATAIAQGMVGFHPIGK